MGIQTMKIMWTRDIYENLYCTRFGWWESILIVCRTTSVDEANVFMEDNPDCSVLTEFDGLILIAFKDDLGWKIEDHDYKRELK